MAQIDAVLAAVLEWRGYIPKKGPISSAIIAVQTKEEDKIEFIKSMIEKHGGYSEENPGKGGGEGKMYFGWWVGEEELYHILKKLKPYFLNTKKVETLIAVYESKSKEQHLLTKDAEKLLIERRRKERTLKPS